MSKIEVNKIGPQCGTTLTVGCGAGQTVAVDANTVTLGRCGGTVSLASGATQSGFGRTGTVDWQTGSIKTATFTAANGEGYFANTSGGAFTMNLPAGTAGNIVSVVDYTNTFQTNNLTISPNGSEKIGGIAADAKLTVNGQSATFVYVDGIEGWKNVQDSTSNVTGNPFIVATGGTITTCGNFKIHTFTGPGTFSVSDAGQPCGSTTVDYLVVGGGGGGGDGSGGSASSGGGGGAGGYRESPGTASGSYTVSPRGASPAVALPVAVDNYPVTVGAGGTTNVNGSNSVLGGTLSITSAGGGAAGNGSGSPVPGANGGSGGGGNGTSGSGGNGNTPPVSPPQGSNGGGSASNGGAGGGGALSDGSNGAGGSGGDAATSAINGSPVARALGGDGAGPGGGGSAGAPQPANSGNGGPGGRYPGAAGGTGGSGIVIIRYKFQ